MRLAETKLLVDGTIFQKIESFTSDGVQSGFFKDGVRISDIIQRLNFGLNDLSWFSFRPIAAKYISFLLNERVFGEQSPHSNTADDKGIRLQSDGTIMIGQFKCGNLKVPGHYLVIDEKKNSLYVGEYYFDPTLPKSLFKKRWTFYL
jgi:hypothetical protein